MRRIRLARRLVSVIVLCFAAVSLILYSQQSLSSMAANNSTQRRNIETLRVVLEPEFPPFEFRATPNGNIEGFDIDFLNALAEELDFKVEIQTLAFDDLIPMIQNNGADASISGISITEERQQIISFSRPYFKAGLAIAVRENDNSITSLATLEGKRVAVQNGSTGEEEAGKVDGASLVKFESAPEALESIRQGKSDATINDAPAIYYALQTENIEGVKVVGQFVTEEFYGIAMPKNSPNLETINQGIETLIANGRYAEIYRKWFGADPPLLPRA